MSPSPPAIPSLSRRALLSLGVGGCWAALWSHGVARAESPLACRMEAGYQALRQQFCIHPAPTGSARLILRRITRSNREHLLLLNVETLATTLVDAATVVPIDTPPPGFAASRYVRRLARQLAPPQPLINAGLRRADHTLDGCCLTVDLCPSRHPLDYHLFEALLTSSLEKPVPLAIALSGSWARRHREDLRWLRTLEQEQALAITWINHTWQHFYDRTRPNNDNFLLATGSDPECEVFAMEQWMIDQQITPTPFFRFPGLVSTPALLEKITDLGLIVIGCERIVANSGPPIRNGGILLLHGNGNEPQGIERFLHHLTHHPLQLVGLAALV